MRRLFVHFQMYLRLEENAGIIMRKTLSRSMVAMEKLTHTSECLSRMCSIFLLSIPSLLLMMYSLSVSSIACVSFPL